MSEPEPDTTFRYGRTQADVDKIAAHYAAIGPKFEEIGRKADELTAEYEGHSD